MKLSQVKSSQVNTYVGTYVPFKMNLLLGSVFIMKISLTEVGIRIGRGTLGRKNRGGGMIELMR